MKNTSLCYLERGGQYLMLHRVKKENDENKDKWIGIGGKFEPGESPEDCVCREVLEETGLRLTDSRLKGSCASAMRAFSSGSTKSGWSPCSSGRATKSSCGFWTCMCRFFP